MRRPLRASVLAIFGSTLVLTTVGAQTTVDKPVLQPDPTAAAAAPTMVLQALDLLPGHAAAGGPCLATAVSSPQGEPSGSGAYLATEILDLEFTTTLSIGPIPGDHLLRLRVETPSGHLYQQLDVPITTDGSSLQRSVAGYPRALPVQRIGHTEGAQPTAMALLPVAGTAIVHSSLYGTWEVTPYLDDASVACGPSQTFRIEALPAAEAPLFSDDFESGTTNSWSQP
jgi:hypothetical protein